MIQFAVHGALGRMGRSIARLALQKSNFKLAAAIDIHAENAVLSDGINNDILYSQANEKNLKNINVLIDFSVPEASLKILQLCEAMKIPMVIGTTGFSEEQTNLIVEAAKKIPILKASNMSIGVNLLFALTAMAGMALKNKGYNAEMTEIHHKHKKDAPSGTAKRLEELLIKYMDLNQNVIHGRNGMPGERKQDELGAFALRGGDVVGDHTVYFLGDGERIELKHQATNRDVFANGALDAAEFIVRQPPGLYSMENVLNLGVFAG